MKAIQARSNLARRSARNLAPNAPPLTPASLRSALTRKAARGRALGKALRPMLEKLQPKVSARIGQDITEGIIGVEQRLIQRVTLGMNQTDLDIIEAFNYYGYLGWQMNPEAIDDGGLEDILNEIFPTLALEPLDLFTRFEDNPEVPVFELLLAQLLRAVYSPRQLYERMVIFWTDHFNIDIFADFVYFFKSTDDRDVIRKHAMGTFPDLLRASAMSPAMLIYLTNDSNVKGHPNENYARELMELHTLGVDNGYTQEDVREVARCFTGWTFSQGEDGIVPGRFRFAPEEHDFGSKVVLGQLIPAGGGIEDGLQVLEILSSHPNTARFIATKMIRYFLTYEPPKQWVGRVADTYLATGGDIRAMLREILKRRWIERAEPKLKRPFHLAVSTFRSLGAGMENPFFVLLSLLEMGQLPFNWGPPNGYPDSATYWSGYILPRWNFAAEAFAEEAGLQLDLPLLAPSLTPIQMMRRINWLLFNETLPLRGRRALRRFFEAEEIDPERIRQGLGLAVAFPQFQEY